MSFLAGNQDGFSSISALREIRCEARNPSASRSGSIADVGAHLVKLASDMRKNDIKEAKALQLILKNGRFLARFFLTLF